MTTCIIAEKPSVARDIARIVGANNRQDGYIEGSGYVVTWAMGHLITLAMPEWKSHTNLTHAGKYFRPSKVKITSPTLPK
ncbi:topoisomerase IA [Prevotella bivia DSM 20514]|uniref:Topoisomerase IA n=1 Tax=Prevotella bivia DSM 20514 TaxID=868129 RepID=I4Z7L9_9BACT|nr:toprim domain-containing protein [Prevotella bivia]EIM32211.1 topoisomerase IA [Prevotella bivia DSM 20514]